MKALLVKVNGKRVRVAGADGSNWHVIGLVELLHGDNKYAFRLDVSLIDNNDKVGRSWQIQDLSIGDVITMEVCEGIPLDAHEHELQLPEGLFASQVEVTPESEPGN